MTVHGVAATLPDVANSVQLHVDLEVQPEAIRGCVVDDSGHRSCFEGWLGLITLVEQVRDDRVDDSKMKERKL